MPFLFRLSRPLTGLVIFLFCCCFSPATQAQTVLTGTVRDAITNEEMVGASVSALRLLTGVTADINGRFRLELPADTVTIEVRTIGYQIFRKQVDLRTTTTLDVALQPIATELKEVVITSEQSLEEKLITSQMSVEKLSSRDAKLLPALFGEVDLLKTLQLKPGIKSGGEGSSGLYIRGGGPDQNLLLMDDALVYNAGHLFGFFSIFNPDAVQDISLYKGAFPARYGGRLSSVVDVKMKEGNAQKLHVNGGIGLISSRITVEGPIKKDTASFILSARRTYFDIFTRQYNRIQEGTIDFNPIPDYYFYDLNGKLQWRLGAKDRLFVTGYFGRDYFKFSQNVRFRFSWGNTAGTMRWNHFFSPKLFLNTSYVFTSYRYQIDNEFGQFSFGLGSRVIDHTLQSELEHQVSDKHTLRYGGAFTYHTFDIGRVKAGSQDGRVAFEAGKFLYGKEMGVFVSDDWRPNPSWEINAGLRLTAFTRQGKWYAGPEPRASVRYSINEKTTVKASYARMQQYVHLASNSGASLPTDIWYPSGDSVRPQRATQVALGVSRLFGKGQYLITNEVYYKWMNRQLDFKNGANLFLNPNLQRDFVFGNGWSYGSELYVEKTQGRTTGWIGYTLSWTWRQFPDIQPEKFPARYDRRHDVSVVALHRLSDKWNLTATWVYGTGNAISLPVARVLIQDIPGADPDVIPVYTKRNTFRMPSYHRLDLGAVRKLRTKPGRQADLTFGVYNAYNRRNPYFIYFEELQGAFDETLSFRARQVSLFPVTPSITYNFQF
jgi:hypothetical protein